MNELKLSKKIPARIKTVRFKWAYKNFIQCTKRYLSIRVSLRSEVGATMIRCDWCKRKLEVDEWFALAQPVSGQDGPKRNWALCHKCADLMGAPDRKKENPKT